MGSAEAAAGVFVGVEHATGGDESAFVTREEREAGEDDAAVEGQAEAAAALGVAVGDATVKWGTGCWMVLDAEVEQGIMSKPGREGGVVHVGSVGDEQGGSEHWSGVCVRAVVGGGEGQ